MIYAFSVVTNALGGLKYKSYCITHGLGCCDGKLQRPSATPTFPHKNDKGLDY